MNLTRWSNTHEPNVDVCLLLLISNAGSNHLWTFLSKARQNPATLPDCPAFLSPPVIALHAIYFPWSFYVPPTLLFSSSQLNLSPLHPRSWLSVIMSLLCSTQPNFCLCVSYTSAHWVIAAIIHLSISHADLLSHTASCKINIVPSMPVLHPFFLPCFFISICHLCFFSVLCLIYFVG